MFLFYMSIFGNMRQLKTNVGDYLKKLRLESGKTLHELAMKVDIDSPMLSKIERGHRLPTKDQIKKLASCFNTSESDLVTMLTAEKIVKEFGVNQITYDAVKNVQKKLAVLLKL